MSAEPVTKIDFLSLSNVARHWNEALDHPGGKADFRQSARLALSGNEGYGPENTLILAAFKGLKELGIEDSEEAISMVKKGLEALGVAVLSS